MILSFVFAEADVVDVASPSPFAALCVLRKLRGGARWETILVVEVAFIIFVLNF